MKRYAVGRRRRSIRRTRRTRFGRRTKRVSKTIKRYVKRAIGRRIENKEILNYGANQALRSAGVGFGPNVINCIPSVSNGNLQNQMIGNEIKCKRGIIKGTINLLPYNASTNPNPGPVWVKMWLLKFTLVQGQYTTPSTSIDWNTFFKVSNGATNFQGNPMDLSFPVNQEYFRVLTTRLYKLGATSYSSTGPVSSGSYFDNSSMSRRFVINYGKYLRKTLKFADNGGQTTNNNCYLVMQCVGADGTSSTSYNMAEYHFVNEFRFEDA